MFVAAIVASGTIAFFSDTETSNGNTFSAGEIDLQIDNESYYNGEFNEGTSWSLKNLEEGDFFFNFLDLKPDDEGEDTISIHVADNDSWACMNIEVTSNDENGCNEPESLDDLTCGEPGLDEGELAQAINFVWWPDDGDNVLEDDEVEYVFNQTSLADISGPIALADADGNGILSQTPLIGGETYYLGKAWCFGDLELAAVQQDGQGKTGSNGPLDRGTGISCNGTLLDNSTQSDSVTGDISFSAVQSRHNERFVCGGGGIGCLDKADIMFVLDSSGSIGSTSMETTRNAAKSFATALAPSLNGNHIGVVDFDSDATLEQELTDILADIDAAIDTLIAGGLTALGDGINVASTELASVRDRADGVAPDYMVIITDGVPNIGADPVAAATAAKAAGTTIYVVGVGTGINQVFLEGIATSPAHYFGAGEFSDLEATLQGLTQCEAN